MRPLLTVPELALVLKIGRTSVYRLVNSGSLAQSWLASAFAFDRKTWTRTSNASCDDRRRQRAPAKSPPPTSIVSLTEYRLRRRDYGRASGTALDALEGGDTWAACEPLLALVDGGPDLRDAARARPLSRCAASFDGTCTSGSHSLCAVLAP